MTSAGSVNGDVLSQHVVSHHAHGEPEDPPLVATDESHPGKFVTNRRAGEQGVVSDS
jgi:hypothetical protein